MSEDVKVKALKSKDLSAEAVLVNALSEAKDKSGAIIIFFDKEDQMTLWSTSVHSGYWALAALMLQDVAKNGVQDEDP